MAKKVNRKNFQLKVGKRLKQLRKLSGLTQEGLATRAKMDWKYYGMIERGELNITLNTLEKICAALNLEMYQVLLFSTDGIKPEPEVNMEKFIDILDKVNGHTKRKILRICQLLLPEDKT